MKHCVSLVIVLVLLLCTSCQTKESLSQEFKDPPSLSSKAYLIVSNTSQEKFPLKHDFIAYESVIRSTMGGQGEDILSFDPATARVFRDDFLKGKPFWLGVVGTDLQKQTPIYCKILLEQAGDQLVLRNQDENFVETTECIPPGSCEFNIIEESGEFLGCTPIDKVSDCGTISTVYGPEPSHIYAER